jgi:mRNA-degrading endonuclease RelE of RelBE toxin-antitoxin system
MRQIRFQTSAKRDLARLPEPDAKDVLEAIEAYATSGIGDVKKLKGYKPPTWRLRVGRFRVLYQYRASTIVVTEISDRRDAYR